MEQEPERAQRESESGRPAQAEPTETPDHRLSVQVEPTETPVRWGAAFRCGSCNKYPNWRVLRRGDSAVTWACDEHLAPVCRQFQRMGEITELVLTRSLAERTLT